MTRATGLLRSTDAQRAAIRPFRAAPGAPLSFDMPVQQPLARIIDQLNLPACVGAALCGCAEAILGDEPHLSWVRLWTDARRRDGNLFDPTVGTWFSSAMKSAVQRGFDPEEPGEATSLVEQTEPDDLDSELAAYDRRQTNAERWRIPTGDLDAVVEALAAGMGVGIGGGVKTPYFNFFARPRPSGDPDVVLTDAALGGNANGHEQRIFAVDVVNGGRRWYIQNSWGHNGGCHQPDGKFKLGCAVVDDSVLRAAWDLDAIRITRRGLPAAFSEAEKRALVVSLAEQEEGKSDPAPYWRACGIDPKHASPYWCGGFALRCLKGAGLCTWNWVPSDGFLWRLNPPLKCPTDIGDVAYFAHAQHHAIVSAVGGGIVELINGNGEGGKVSRSTKRFDEVTAFYSIERLL